MAYQAQLDDGRTLTLEQQGEQTLISLEQQGQAQASGTTTGTWTAPPQVHLLQDRVVVELRTNPPVYFALHGNQIQSLGEAPDLGKYGVVELKAVPDGQGMKPMEPMTPMKPMKPL
ncbi:hypothetical protein [Deinococcus aquatilis]|uniref:hypothetical protein n=1 Tax=Deinococcus aquatilis TaxID=519440 RepID=UPI000364DD48|nr:hypothetical protein [Deinococcus aquatilis]